MLLLLTILWLPALGVGGEAWVAVVALLIVFAAVQVVRHPRSLALSPLLLAYVGVYALSGIHGGLRSGSEIVHYFLRPLVPMVVATVVATAAGRRRILVGLAVLVLLEVPMTIVQTVRNFVDFGRHASTVADSVTGALGGSQAGVVTLVAVAVAAVVAGAWLTTTVRTRWAVALVAALVSVGVFSSTRAVPVFVVAAALGIAVVTLASGVSRPSVRRVGAIAVASLAAAALAYGGTRAIYPGAYYAMFSSQETSVLGGAAAEGIQPPVVAKSTGQKATVRPAAPSAPSTSAPAGPASAPPSKSAPAGPAPPARPTGVELLPGRIAQMRLALRLSLHAPWAVALLGRGLGASVLDPGYALAQDVPEPQRTGSTWIGALLTETGWLGVAAFAGLLLWLCAIGLRLQRAPAATAVDRSLGAALPGLAALTAVGAAFTTILDVRAYSLVFWVLIGIALSAVRELPPTAQYQSGPPR